MRTDQTSIGSTVRAPAAAPPGSDRGQRVERVTFSSGGSELVGHLFLPDRPVPDGGHAAMVVAGPWTQVKEQTADAYGAKLATWTSKPQHLPKSSRGWCPLAR